MYKYSKTNIKLLILILLCSLCSGTYLFGQTTIQKPMLFSPVTGNPITFACASTGANLFQVRFDVSGASLGPDNTYTVILSDPNGDFDSGTQDLGNFKSNSLFNVTTSFAFPANTYGASYRIKIVSSHPLPDGLESVPSDPFEAYFIDTDPATGRLVLDDGDGDFGDAVVICGGAPVDISVNILNPDFTYRWFRVNPTTGADDVIPGQTDSTLQVTQPGTYFAAVERGACTNSSAARLTTSNRLTVTSVSPMGLTIQDSSGADLTTVEICANETFELNSSITGDPTLNYIWYKDDVPITGLPSNATSYTIPASNQFGVYRLEIEVGGCISNSQNVTIQQRSGSDFDIDIQSSATRIRLPRETIELTVDHNASSETIQWFLNGNPIPASNNALLNVVGEGVYCAEVVDNSTSCPFSKKTEEITVVDAVDLDVAIRTAENYTECENENTVLSIVGITATGTDGNDYSLSEDQIDFLTADYLQWVKDGTDISGATLDTYTVGSYLDNGSYTLDVELSATSTISSDPIDVLLGLGNVEVMSSSVSNNLCPGETITFSLTTVAGYTYRWFKDGTELTVADPSNVVIDEIGLYSVTYEGFGCLTTITEINVLEFDDSVFEVSPSSTAVLSPGETVTITASGADSYEWFAEDGTLLSTTDALDVVSLGTFTVIGTVGGCTAQREINVVEDDGKLIIPNILTPFNGDGINDTWELPNRFAFQTNVQVIIYNSRGNEILNTMDYQNNWPEENNLKDGMLFYYKVLKDNNLVKAGTISILQ